jgi:hypothetical protein
MPILVNMIQSYAPLPNSLFTSIFVKNFRIFAKMQKRKLSFQP